MENQIAKALDLKGQQQYDYILKMLETAKEQGRLDREKEIIEIISNWKDTSIKNERIALMITNGGYIHKWTLIEKIRQIQNGDIEEQKT
jgi:hypothetical protein